MNSAARVGIFVLVPLLGSVGLAAHDASDGQQTYQAIEKQLHLRCPCDVFFANEGGLTWGYTGMLTDATGRNVHFLLEMHPGNTRSAFNVGKVHLTEIAPDYPTEPMILEPAGPQERAFIDLMQLNADIWIPREEQDVFLQSVLMATVQHAAHQVGTRSCPPVGGRVSRVCM